MKQKIFDNILSVLFCLVLFSALLAFISIFYSACQLHSIHSDVLSIHNELKALNDSIYW